MLEKTSDIMSELGEIFRDVLDQPELALSRASNASNVDGWDSLAHVNLVTAVQKHFGVKFALGELEELKNVGEMADLIVRKRSA
jgi:acyl carrier protein